MSKKKNKKIKSKPENEPMTSSKKEIVLNEKKGNKNILIGVAAALVITGFAAFTVFSENEKFSVVKAEAGQVSIPVSEVSDGHAHHYTYNGLQGDINFFVLQSSDGIIRTAFDACDVCYREKKGYRQEGDYMICNNCGQRFASVKINELRGGCNPAPLDRAVRGGSLIINASDIEKGAIYF